jgi:integrase
MSLSDAKVRNAKPRIKSYKIADGEGLFLVIMPSGSKYWRLKYFFAGKEKLLALGVYPEISLADARERRAQARKVLAAGNDPGEAKKEAKRLVILKSDNSFEAVAREWLEKRKHEWTPSTARTILFRLETYVLPKLGPRPIADITAPEILAVLRVVEARGALVLAGRLKQYCGQIFMYAIATSRAERNPVPDLRGALKTPVTKHYSFLNASELPQYLKKLEAYDGSLETRQALRLLLLTFVRTKELRGAQWQEIDWEKAEWRIPAERMKMRELHIVPLSRQALIVACPMSEEQRELQEELVERYDRLRSSKVDPRVDNALAITTDGRKLSTDARMLSASAPDFDGSKVNRLVENVVAIWERTAPTRGTQMIFADMGVNPTDWGYSPYQDIIRKLIAAGVPAEQIATIGDAESDAKKQALFEKVRQGSVRVLLGSTQKMGTGTNVQKRLVALHHLDAPWKPAEVEQREGRILRQGNENEEVAVYRYVTEGSFDAYMWQALETKARFIGQVITGDNSARRAEDIGGQELSYAEVKAIASGNPAVLTLAEADAELQRLALLKKNHLDEQYLARNNVRGLPGTIAKLSERLTNLTADQATIADHAADPIIIGGRTPLRDDVTAVLGGQLDSMPLSVPETTRVPVGVYHGLSFGLVLHPQFPPDVYLEGAMCQ